jgi:hypothetical protein
MGDDKGLGIVLIGMLVVSGLSFCVGGQIGHDGRDAAIRDEAVKAGVAEYYLDANNERQFRWKAVKP